MSKRTVINTKEAAKKYALMLLKIRPRAVSELKARLGRMGFQQDNIESVLEEFKKKGLLDDFKFSKLYATSKLDLKSLGLRSIDFELKKKGIDDETRLRAMEEIGEGYDEHAAVRKAAQARLTFYKGLSALAVKRRLYNFLLRKGFSASVIWKVFEELGI